MDKETKFITWVIVICAMLVFGLWYGRKDWDCKFKHGPKLRELEQRIEKLEKAHEATKDLPVR